MFQITQEEFNVRREIVFILAANSILAQDRRTTRDRQQGTDFDEVLVGNDRILVSFH